MQKRHILLFLLAALLFVNGTVRAQELKVLEFRADMSETACAANPRTDANGVNCGLILLGLTVPDATFDGDIIGKPDYRDGQWWVYMMKGSNWIEVKTAGKYLPLRYEFGTKIESNVTYIMTVEVPTSDSTDYFLEQARQAARAGNKRLLIESIEKVAINSVPEDLKAQYEQAVEEEAYNALVRNLKVKTNNWTTLPDEDTYKQCRSFITKYPHSEHRTAVSQLLKTEGKKYIKVANQSSSTTPKVPTMPSSTAPSSPMPKTYSGSSRMARKLRNFASLLTVGAGAEVFTPLDSAAYEGTDVGGGAEVLLRIGRNENRVNLLLGIGGSKSTVVKPNLNASVGLRLNIMPDDDCLYLSLGTKFKIVGDEPELMGIVRADDGTAQPATEPVMNLPFQSIKVELGYCGKNLDLYLGVGFWDILGPSFGAGFRWWFF